MKRSALAFAMLLAVLSSSSRAADCQVFDHEHAAWTAQLSKYVSGGRVDYTRWKQEGTGPLEAYVGSLAQVSAECFGTFTPPQQIAFLIDAYNANTVHLVLENLPIASIRKIGLLPGAAFRRDFIALPAVGVGEIALDDIEHGTLRKRYPEPRIHFALVCAARSCPSLRSEAYRGAALDEQLDDQGRTFLADPAKNRFDAARDTLFLSQIFDWFSGDFVKAKGSIGAFVAPFLSGAAADAATRPATKIEFLPYDWSLNGA